MTTAKDALAAIRDHEPISRQDLMKELGVTNPGVINLVTRNLIRDKVITINKDNDYVLFKDEVQKEKPSVEKTSPTEQIQTSPPAESKTKEKPSQVSMGLTDYDAFKQKGLQIGFPDNLVTVVADHVFKGGDYRDLDWVYEALTEMNLRADLLERWYHSWRSFIAPGTLMSSKVQAAMKGETKGEVENAEGSGYEYIIDDNDMPQRVGKGVGNLTYQDAVDLAKLRAARRSVAAASSSPPETTSAILTSVMSAVEKMSGIRQGGEGAARSYVVTPGPNGDMKVQQVDGNAPLVIPAAAPAPAQPPQSPTQWILEPDGHGGYKTRQLAPGEPVVVNPPPAPAPSDSKIMVVDRNTGRIEQAKPGEPIIIMQSPPPAAAGPGTLFQMSTPDGKPLVMDINSLLTIQKAQNEERRAQEVHESKIEFTKTAKDFFGKLVNIGNEMMKDRK